MLQLSVTHNAFAFLSATEHYTLKKKIKNKEKKIQPQSQIMRVLISAEMLIWEDTSKLH